MIENELHYTCDTKTVSHAKATIAQNVIHVLCQASALFLQTEYLAKKLTDPQV
jgi:hypothetical protein